MENLKELLRKFYNGGIYKATGEKGVTYINYRPSFEEMYEALNKSDVISSVCKRCKSTEIKRTPVTYDCYECGCTWQTDL